MGTAKIAGKLVAPIALNHAPALTAGFVRQALDRAIDGFGPLPGAAAAADRRLEEHGGDEKAAIRGLIDTHVRLASIRGLPHQHRRGGHDDPDDPGERLRAGPSAVPHGRGDRPSARLRPGRPRVRNAVFACMLGEDTVKWLIKKQKLPSSPMAIATAPARDPDLDARLTAEVTGELLTRVAGKRAIAVVGRRTPVIGGGVGAVADGYSTYQVGRYAARELRARST